MPFLLTPQSQVLTLKVSVYICCYFFPIVNKHTIDISLTKDGIVMVGRFLAENNTITSIDLSSMCIDHHFLLTLNFV